MSTEAEAAGRQAEERRCIVTGETGPKEGLIRFVIGPQASPVPDLGERLPGRGIWVSARREAVETAIRKGLFSRAARMKVEASEALADEVERLLAKRAMEALGLARKAGCLILGFEKVMAAIGKGEVALLIEARDGSEDGARKLAGALKAREQSGGKHATPILSPLWTAEMGLALGRANVVHAALTQGSMKNKVLADLARLESYGRKERPAERSSG
ncbi:MAG TPA: RNA-binding protein [Parvibaculum sp.]|uniref:RNA-binding protein n=1 Tax=Parvibaculum sp. TaxID=2024848 RepID=UPI002C6FFB58|nr:RNA-binding protein [Parvibaculum sp.]HMM14040.1 RNA-binding protein [Parvibaculum sp.]